MQALKNLFSGYQQLSANQTIPDTVPATTSPPNDFVGSQHLMDSTETPSQAVDNPFLISTTINSIASSLPSQAPPTSAPRQSKSWFPTSLWASPQQDEMNLQYDIESGQTASQALHTTTGKVEGNEQQFSLLQRVAVYTLRKVQLITALLPQLPELTYPQRLLLCAMFSIGGIFLLISAMFSLPQIFFGQASKFAWSFTIANLFFISASLFITDVRSHFAPHRRFTTFMYLASIGLTLLTCVYVPYMIIVLPVLLVQILAMVFHLLSFFTSAVNVEMNLGKQILTSIFRNSV